MPVPIDAYTQELIQVTQIYFSAIYAVTVWDWIISLPVEYRRIWKAPWSLVKFCYFGNRYYTLANLIYTLYGFNGHFTAAGCEKFYMWEPGLAMGTTLFAEAILVIRTYALWGRNRWILAILAFGFATETAVLSFAVTQFKPVPTTDPTDPTSTGACIAGGGPGGHDWSMAYWVSPICLDTLMLVLTVIRAFQYRHRGVNSGLLNTFMRDGILYFFVVFIVNLINTIFYSLPTPALQAVNSPMSLLMTSIMASRIILSLRKEEQTAMEAVSKDWQINTFLRNKHGKSGGSNPSPLSSKATAVAPVRAVTPYASPSFDNGKSDLELGNFVGVLPCHSAEIEESCEQTKPVTKGVRIQVQTGMHTDQEKQGESCESERLG